MPTTQKAKKRKPMSIPGESLETIRQVQRRIATPSPSYLPSPDKGNIKTPAPPRSINDPPPSWPRRPFSKKSKSYQYANTYCYFGGKLGSFSIPVPPGPDEKDKRLRHDPLWSEVCAFLRWDIGFNWQVPTWSDWLTVLMTDCELNPNHCESLEIPRIVSILDKTPIPDELNFAANVIDDLADKARTLEELMSSEIILSESQVKTGEHSIHSFVVRVAALLLKVHGLPQNLQVLGQYPGDSCSDFVAKLNDRLGGDTLESSTPFASGLKQLANRVRAMCTWENAPPGLGVQARYEIIVAPTKKWEKEVIRVLGNENSSKEKRITIEKIARLLDRDPSHSKLRDALSQLTSRSEVENTFREDRKVGYFLSDIVTCPLKTSP